VNEGGRQGLSGFCPARNDPNVAKNPYVYDQSELVVHHPADKAIQILSATEPSS
jgi:hypothetical protein